MGEHLPCKQGVKGSNPFISTFDNEVSRQFIFITRLTCLHAKPKLINMNRIFEEYP